jgi:hypothetical protein
MSPLRPTTETPSAAEMFDELSFFPIALVVSATIAPGLTLCIPGLIFATVFLLLPLVALAIAGLVVAAVVAAPILAVRGIRALVQRRAAAQLDEPVPSTFVPSRFTAAAVQRLTADAPVHR